MLTAQSCPTPCDTMRTVACQAPLSMEFSRQEYWSVLALIPSPEDLPDPGIKPRSPAMQADSLHCRQICFIPGYEQKKSFPLATGSNFAYYNSSERKADLAPRQGQRSNTRKTALLRTLNTY